MTRRRPTRRTNNEQDVQLDSFYIGSCRGISNQARGWLKSLCYVDNAVTASMDRVTFLLFSLSISMETFCSGEGGGMCGCECLGWGGGWGGGEKSAHLC